MIATTYQLGLYLLWLYSLWLYLLGLHLEQHVGEALGNEAEGQPLGDLAAQIEHAARQLLEATLHLVRVRVGVRVSLP